MKVHPAALARAVAACALAALASCGGGGGGGGGSSPAPSLATLVSVSTLPPGAQCTNGGRQVGFGSDTNGNGALDPAEVGNTFYACDGGAGPAGAAGRTSLISLAAEPAGANCANGGNMVSFGLDADADGVLAASEVNGSGYVCGGATGATGPTGATGATGANGLNSLTLLSPEPAGAHCATGGTRIEAGLDANRNGALEAAEVALTDYACNGAAGATGATGATGASGLSSLSLATPETAGANCAAGGSKITSGLDADRDGVLDSDEVSSTVYACNGAPGATGATGASGLNSILSTTAEPAGANCATGGTKLTAGLDTNRNGTLDLGEVTGTSYTCNGMVGPAGPAGATGFSSILNSTAEPAGANCAAGGTKLTSGLDGNRNGVLDAAEVTGTSYICSGAQGPTGPMGPSGPQGPSAAVNVYGDGSAGAFNVALGQTLDLTTLSGFNALAGRQSLQFTSITVSGTLILPSGTVLRATGDVTVTGTGTIIVAAAAQDSGNGAPNPGFSLAAAGPIHGGVGLGPLQAAQLRHPGPAAGGAGDRNVSLGAVTGGEGGGSLVILARGAVSVQAGGAINANGNSGINPGGVTDIPGAGGGGGGIVLVGARGPVTIGGAIRAAGGAGAPGINGNGGAAGAGGGGGGGGGIIHFITASTPTVTGTLLVSGGAGGIDAFGTSTNQPGGGGGASGGDGGDGGYGNPVAGQATQASTAGSPGYTFSTVVPEPENLFVN